MTKTMAALAAGFAAPTLAPAMAAADRAPTAQEQMMISEALHFQGFDSWGEIEWDDGEWEVDNAIASNGERRDIKLDQSFNVIGNERDD